MESGIRVLLLTAAAVLLALPCAKVSAAAPQDAGRADGDAPQQDAGQTNGDAQQQGSPDDNKPPRVVEPEVERRPVHMPGIHASNLEIGLHYGVLSIEDFGANQSYGGMLAYHVTEDAFLRADVGRSTGGRTSAETVGSNPPQLPFSRQLTYYDLALGYNLLPGEAFIGRGTALVSSFYVLAGVGGTEFGGERKVTVVLGAGYQVLPVDWLAVRFEVENHIFNQSLLGTSKMTNNLEARIGTSFIF